eukprot:Ihof_evm22s20 gene=Ihof_evmTU22s20
MTDMADTVKGPVKGPSKKKEKKEKIPRVEEAATPTKKATTEEVNNTPAQSNKRKAKQQEVRAESDEGKQSEKKKKQKTTTNDIMKGFPKQPKKAYNFFVKEFHSEAKKNEAIEPYTFSKVGQLASTKWKEMDNSQRIRYEKMEEGENQRYEHEYDIFRSAHPHVMIPPPKSRLMEAANSLGIQRTSIYQLFLSYKFEQLKNVGSTASLADKSTAIAQEWRMMPASEKALWSEKFKESQKEYLEKYNSLPAKVREALDEEKKLKLSKKAASKKGEGDDEEEGEETMEKATEKEEEDKETSSRKKSRKNEPESDYDSDDIKILDYKKKAVRVVKETDENVEGTKTVSSFKENDKSSVDSAVNYFDKTGLPESDFIYWAQKEGLHVYNELIKTGEKEEAMKTLVVMWQSMVPNEKKMWQSEFQKLWLMTQRLESPTDYPVYLWQFSKLHGDWSDYGSRACHTLSEALFQ